MDSVIRWANYVKDNPNWRKYHTEFINAQFENSYRVIFELLKQPNGKDKIKKLFNIQNVNCCPGLLK